MNNASGTPLEFHKITTLKEAEDFVYASYLRAATHQDYAAKDAGKRHPELTRSLLRQKSITPCVVVTGSKGKGSVANMISRILQTNYTVGLMTSPHITDFRERFRVNDTMISETDFCRLMAEIQPEILDIASDLPDSVCISPMGIQADLALTYFSEKHTDFNVFECGKGAKYDDVNNIRHDYAVINRIFLEHTRELGDTLAAIAEDKSHVITGEQKCVYFAEQEPEVLKVYAKHYQTGEVIPAELIEKLDKSGKYGQGFATTEYLAASYLDMDFHAVSGDAADKKVIKFVDQTNNVPANLNVMDFEQQTLGRRGLLKQIPSRYRTTYFNHTMGGGYTAGYYSYIWAEVLDCDAFEAFKETGDIFNQECADKFRKYVLTPGGIDDAMDMYKNFRGKEPGTDPLLKNRGLK